MAAKKNPRPVKSKAPVKTIGRSAMRKSKGGGSLSQACCTGEHFPKVIITV